MSPLSAFENSVKTDIVNSLVKTEFIMYIGNEKVSLLRIQPTGLIQILTLNRPFPLNISNNAWEHAGCEVWYSSVR